MPMTGRVAGKVALVTGAARGQGRSHALRLAEEGADIIAVDICEQIESNPYPLSTEADLAETAQQVEKLGQRIVTVKADVRERSQLRDAVSAGMAQLDRLDVPVANPGILPLAMGDPDPMAFPPPPHPPLTPLINT